MKPILKLFLPCVALIVLLTYSGCGPDPTPAPTVEEEKLGLLSATWNATSVTLDGVAKTADYSNFKLTVSGTYPSDLYDYSTSGRPAVSPWPSAGKWGYGSDPATTIIRDKGLAKQLEMQYTVTESTLEITFMYNGTGEARTSQVSGTWVFSFSK